MSAPVVADRRALGTSGLEVSGLCVGTAAWGAHSPDHGVTVDEHDALAAAARMFGGPMNYLDTSNNYGDGEAERRIGRAIASRGGLPAGFVLQTKLDRDPRSGSFSPARLRSSLDESLARLGLDRVPALLLHDPEHIGFAEASRAGGALDTLVAMRDEGLADAIGVGGGPAAMLIEFVHTEALDIVLTHSRFTLVDRTADALITSAHERGVAVVNGAVFAGGVLASYPRSTDLYAYGPGDPRLLAVVDAMGHACATAGVPLAAAAVQQSLRDPRITSTVCGVNTPEQVDRLLELATAPIPDELWAVLDGLTPAPETWRND